MPDPNAAASAGLANLSSANDPTVLMVVDTSGSMAGTRLDEAKRALTTSIASLRTDQPAGLRSYSGNCGNPGTLRVPIGGDNRASLSSAIASLSAGGGTPTPSALSGAAADLVGVAGPRTIVLISDGESTCGDPCPTARTIKNDQGVDFKVHTVGYKTNQTAEGELDCIAKATGGTYVTVDDEAGLKTVIGDAISGRSPVTASPSTGRPGTNFTLKYRCPVGQVPNLSILNGNGAPTKLGLTVGLAVSGNQQDYVQGVTAIANDRYTAKITCNGTPSGQAVFAVQSAPYVALGDSYASGEGGSSFDSATDKVGVNMCHRTTSTAGWAKAVAAKTGLEMDFAACSDAVIEDFTRANPTNGHDLGQPTISSSDREMPQLNNLGIKGQPANATQLVTLSIGGNDLGFPNVLADCVIGTDAPGKADCRSRNGKKVEEFRTYLRNGRPDGCRTLPGVIGVKPYKGKTERVCGRADSLSGLYKKIVPLLAEGGTLVVAEYPRLFFAKPMNGARGGSCRVGSAYGLFARYRIDGQDLTWINEQGVLLNKTIAAEVRLTAAWAKRSIAEGGGGRPDISVKSVSVDASFEGQRICNGSKTGSLFNGLLIECPGLPKYSCRPKHLSFHPNDAGQLAQGKTIVKSVA